jgi:hypothetical protein
MKNCSTVLAAAGEGHLLKIPRRAVAIVTTPKNLIVQMSEKKKRKMRPNRERRPAAESS